MKIQMERRRDFVCLKGSKLDSFIASKLGEGEIENQNNTPYSVYC